MVYSAGDEGDNLLLPFTGDAGFGGVELVDDGGDVLGNVVRLDGGYDL